MSVQSKSRDYKEGPPYSKIGTRSVHVGRLNEVLSQGTPNYNCTWLSIVTMFAYRTIVSDPGYQCKQGPEQYPKKSEQRPI